MIIGYARVSKEEQSINRQLDTLKSYDSEKIMQEKFTGTKKYRPGLDELFRMSRPGDTIVVESISRLGRNTLDILSLIEKLEKETIYFVSIKDITKTVGISQGTLYRAINEPKLI